MQLVFVVLAFGSLVACGSKTETKPPIVETKPVVAPDAASDLCELGTNALASLTTCGGRDVSKDMEKARQTFSGVVSTVRAAPGGNSSSETTCAQLLHTIDEELQTAGCMIPLSPAARTRMLDLVEAWYAVRTAVTPTGNAAADAVIAKIVKIRDASCACQNAQCLEQLGKDIESIGAFGSDAPPAAQTMGASLLDDVDRCGARIKKPVRR